MINDQTADENLWEAIQEGHTKAFSLLYDRYWYRVYTTAFHHLKDQETCIEVVHDIFLNLWQKRAQ
ncbi:MAG: polymerase sigma-70 factor, partial [Bacteroidetes bacterium]|nr:polymerase sigma-70 factor [Bacteroidota bacterium]